MQPGGVRATSPHIALICQDVGKPSHRPEKELSGNVDLVAGAASFPPCFPLITNATNVRRQSSCVD
jgi:hypothetical protein